ncbi:MAG: hypothetical protein KBT47_09445 [Armatimonadetes bacterium]|nr:hypothetical protein [Candidatus Hippobium faecium]
MVRNVKITSPVPTEKIYWQNFALQSEKDYPLIRTCSFNYKGKTMVCITSISLNDTIKVDWTVSAKDLYLKTKSSYTIKEIFPEKKQVSKGKEIKASVSVKPLETKIFIIE